METIVMKTRRFVFLAFLVFWGSSAELQAQGGYAGAILRMGLASKSEAMGRAFTAVVGNSESAFYNPASAPVADRRVVDLSFRALPLDRTFAYIGFATHLRPKSKYKPEDPEDFQYGGFSISWIYGSVANIEGRDFDGVKFGDFNNSQNVFNFTFALRFHRRLSVGMGAHVIWNRFPGLGKDNQTVSANSASLDFGLLLWPVDGLWIGATIRNFNGKYTWDSNKLYERGTQKIDRFPKIWRIGVATTKLYHRWLLTFDIEGSEVYNPKIYVGTSFQLRPRLELRGGLREGNLTLGAAYSFKLIRKQTWLHYAYVGQPNELSPEHVFSWSFEF